MADDPLGTVCVTYKNFIMDKKNLEGDNLAKRVVEQPDERINKICNTKSCKKISTRRCCFISAVIIAVVCLAVAFFVVPFGSGTDSAVDELGIEQPEFDAYRAASPDVVKVERLLDEGEVYEALDLAESLLKASDKKIKQHEQSPLYDDEEWLYEYQAEKIFNSEMRWVYIYLLVVLECERDAVRELKKYIADKEYSTNLEEANRMLMMLE